MAVRGSWFLTISMLVLSQSVAAQDRKDLEDELDIFAAAHLDNVQAMSIAEGVEYCGWFGLDSGSDFVATPAKRGEPDHCDLEDPPDDLEILASYHTHGAYDRDADTEVPSVEDLRGDFEADTDGYIATPGGRLWLNLFEERISILLCGPGCLVFDNRYRPCPAFPPDSEYTIATLIEREEADTGEC